MKRFTLVCLALALLPVAAPAQNPAARQAAAEREARIRQIRILQLEAEIKRTKRRLALLEEQLAALVPQDQPAPGKAPEAPQLVINDLARGQKGRLATGPNSPDSWFEVVQVLGKDEFVAVSVVVLLRAVGDPKTGVAVTRGPAQRSKPFIIRGQSTAGLADGGKVEIPGVLEVVDTKTLPSGATHFVLSPSR